MAEFTLIVEQIAEGFRMRSHYRSWSHNRQDHFPLSYSGAIEVEKYALMLYYSGAEGKSQHSRNNITFWCFHEHQKQLTTKPNVFNRRVKLMTHCGYGPERRHQLIKSDFDQPDAPALPCLFNIYRPQVALYVSRTTSTFGPIHIYDGGKVVDAYRNVIKAQAIKYLEDPRRRALADIGRFKMLYLVEEKSKLKEVREEMHANRNDGLFHFVQPELIPPLEALSSITPQHDTPEPVIDFPAEEKIPKKARKDDVMAGLKWIDATIASIEAPIEALKARRKSQAEREEARRKALGENGRAAS